MHGDLGQSVSAHGPIAPFIGPQLVNTAILAGATVIVMVPLALALGILAATRAGRPSDHIVSITSLAIIAVPEFVTGTLLILVFATTLQIWGSWHRCRSFAAAILGVSSEFAL